jgi:hypothetical protein
VTFNEGIILNRNKIVQISDSEAANKPEAEDEAGEEDLNKTLVNNNTSLDMSNDIFTDAKEESFIYIDDNKNKHNVRNDKENNTDVNVLRRSQRIRQERYGEWRAHFAFLLNILLEMDQHQ